MYVYVLYIGIWFYQSGNSGGKDLVGCTVEVDVKDSEESVSLPAGLFAILNGGTYFYYIPCLLIFAAIWQICDEEGKTGLAKCIFGPEAEAAEVAEKIGVGAAAVLGILVSIANLIAAGVSENCGTPAANAFIALNVFVTLFNASACAQVSVIYFWKEGIKECLKN